MAAILRTPGVRRLIPYNGFVMATVGLLAAAAVIFYERDLDVPEYWYGLAISAFGLGSAGGLAIAGRYQYRWPLPRIIVVATPFYALACAIGGTVDQPAVLAVSWFIWGLLLGPEFVVSETFLINRIADAERGRAFAGVGVANSLGMAVGSLAAAPLLDAFSARSVILGTGVFVLALALMWIGPALQGDRWPDGDPAGGSSESATTPALT